MNLGQLTPDLPYLLAGARLTLLLASLAFVAAIVIGIVVALLRLSPIRPLSWLASFYVDLFRSTPLFVQLVWFFYALPILTGLSLDPVATGVMGLGLYTASYFAEVFRTGILSLPSGQREAALAIGMTELQAMRRVILPQAVRRVLPPSVSVAVTLVKDSSLASVVSVPELLWQASSLAATTFRPLEALTVAAMIYFVITYPLTLLGNAVHRRVVRAT